jgi:hypothetical protein
MRPQRSRLPPSPQWKLDEDGVNDAPGDFAERISVEEKERSGAMTFQKEVERFAERQFSRSALVPSLSDALMSFRVISVESFSSMARSAVEAGDKLPVPVFDKSGSAL